MQELKLKGHEVQSLQELRERFEPEEIRKAFTDGTLEKWLRDRYYEREAETVSKLHHQAKEKQEKQEQKGMPSPAKAFEFISCVLNGVEQEDESLLPYSVRKNEYELCQTLGVNYADAGMMTPEQKADYDRKLGILKRFTDDSELLDMAVETATDQSELARLLKCGYETIILCNAEFSIPISKGNIRYVCIGNVTLENAFTAEQYRRAGITVERIKLPDATDEAAEKTAKNAAKRHGYDDFDDSHNAFASLVHKTLSTSECWCADFMQDACFDAMDVDLFRTAFQARQAINKVVNTAYDKAGAYFAPDSGKNVAEKAVLWYERKIQLLLDILANLRAASVPEDALKKLSGLAEGATPELRRQFNQELREEASYYKMYQRSYFLDKPEIESINDPTESELANIFLRPFSADGDNYAISGLIETVSEIQDDMDSRAKTFSGCAHDLYRAYCEEIEEAAQELGEKLPDGVLEMFNVEKAG